MLEVGKYYQYKAHKAHIIKVLHIQKRPRVDQITVEDYSVLSPGKPRVMYANASFIHNFIEVEEDKLGCTLLKEMKIV